MPYAAARSDAPGPQRIAASAPRRPCAGLAALMAKLGVSQQQIDASAPDGEPLMAHRHFDERQLLAPERARAASPIHRRCPGTLRLEPAREHERARLVVCDHCNEMFALRAQAIDAAVQAASRRERANLPPLLAAKTFCPDVANRAARRLIADWLKEGASGMVPAPALWGPPGVGKSHLLVRTAEALLRAGREVRFWRVRELLDRLPCEFGGEELTWQRACEVPVLILDDLGSERDTAWRRDRVQELVSLRHAAALPVLISTNVAPKDWQAAFGARTASRLRGMTLAVRLAGPDRRRSSLGQPA